MEIVCKVSFVSQIGQRDPVKSKVIPGNPAHKGLWELWHLCYKCRPSWYMVRMSGDLIGASVWHIDVLADTTFFSTHIIFFVKEATYCLLKTTPALNVILSSTDGVRESSVTMRQTSGFSNCSPGLKRRAGRSRPVWMFADLFVTHIVYS